MSNLIKNNDYTSVDEYKKIKVISDPSIHKKLATEPAAVENSTSHPLHEAQLAELKRQVMKEAEQQADAHLKQAMAQADALKKQAEHDIALWWDERRQQDEEQVEKIKEEGFKQGYDSGVQKAKNDIQIEYQAYIDEGRALLELAQNNKEQIIQEAEPFLLELSCHIAEKIIRQQLTIAQEWMIELVKDALTRQREKGLVTLCVSPEQYPYVQQFREELLLVLDSQAELQILPDGNVRDHGCVVRSSFGTIDATIDTQLQEIKQALYHLAMQNGDDNDGHTSRHQ